MGPEYFFKAHYNDVIMTTMASQITSLTVVYSIIYSGVDQRKHQSSTSLAFVWGIHRDRWIPRTKGQQRGKCFHLMTSSCHRCMLYEDEFILSFVAPQHLIFPYNKGWLGNHFELNTLRPRQNGCHFADDSFKCIFLNENVWIPIKISLKFVPKGPINNIQHWFR